MDNYPVEVLNSVEIGNMPPHKLRLKIGCPVILLRNLDAKNGLCNGTRLICRSFRDNVIMVEIVSGSHKGVSALIPRVTLTPTSSAFPIPFRRLQFPIALAFGMTINKAQGQTLSRVGIYLPDPVFSHGQLYVAMSRVGTPSAIKFFFGSILPYGQPKYSTTNVVYKEVYNR
jgi:ATP-dependent DNA helicase PIF1